MTTFTDLGLNPLILKSLATEGYTTPTPIQAQAIPVVMTGKDLLGIAQTGTGKTAAFALPLLHRLAANPKPAAHKGTRVLVLSPTRELASQIAESFRTYGRNLNLRVAVMFGGVSHRSQIKAIERGVDVLVATPGRLLDHLDERNVVLTGTEILVLDEADQMLDMGFIRPIRRILSKLSARRQNLFFSATMPGEIGTLAAEMLVDPVRVAVTPVAKTADRVAQRVIHVEAAKKKSLLVELFSDPAMSRVLVFTRTKRGADKVCRHLETAGILTNAIHGNKSQGQREAALAAFKAGRIRGLVATDIAARGIDIDDVSHVVNYELPNIPESYVHRIGRTARAGAGGNAISLCDGEERAFLRDIERLTRQTIPSTDRRGDVKLVVEDKRAAGAEPERGPRPGRGDSRGAPRRDGASRPRSVNGENGSRGFATRERTRGEKPSWSPVANHHEKRDVASAGRDQPRGHRGARPVTGGQTERAHSDRRPASGAHTQHPQGGSRHRGSSNQADRPHGERRSGSAGNGFSGHAERPHGDRAAGRPQRPDQRSPAPARHGGDARPKKSFAQQQGNGGQRPAASADRPGGRGGSFRSR